MSQINLGNISNLQFKVGSGDCSIYLGTTLLYSPTQPEFQGKWLATYTGGTTSSAECDSSSAITKNEINKGSLVSVEIGDCVTNIGNDAFYEYTSLTSITIPNSVTSIGSYAFNRCISLSSIDIPNSVTSISDDAFQNCRGLTSVDIPDSVTSIGGGAFWNCSGLTSMTVGSGVTSIGRSAFYYCSSLTSLTILATTPPTLGSGAFNYTPIANGTGYIYVPSGSVDTYKAEYNWKRYASRITAIPNS